MRNAKKLYIKMIEMDYRRKGRIGSFSKRRSYEAENLEESCVEMRNIMARLEVVEIA